VSGPNNAPSGAPLGTIKLLRCGLRPEVMPLIRATDEVSPRVYRGL